MAFDKNERGRTWAGVVYPDSAPKNWIDLLDATHLTVFISPLHDKDLNPDHTVKKAHWHVMIMWDNPTTRANAQRLFDMIGGVMDQMKVESTPGMARYLLHLDNPEKHQYLRKDLTVLGAGDYEEIIQKSQMRAKTAKQLFDFIVEENVISMRWLYDYIRENDLDDWLNILTNQNTMFIRALIASNAWELQRINDAEKPLAEWEAERLGMLKEEFKKYKEETDNNEG